ncbi:MAG: hypothetical protein L0H96_24220 [Humibacillus sp.]|nr:hypothetical protein [Humibacillus sp.]MDN5779991.1 hypothetical protein [Humibacillus sp.]
MRKSTVVKIFLGSLIGAAASLVLLIVAGLLAIGSDAFVMDGPDVVGIKAGLFGWTMLALVAVAVLGMVAAVAAQLLAWVGAVLHTAQLPDKTWFVVVLVGGLVSLGFLATLAYVIGGPGDDQPVTRDPAHPFKSDTPVPSIDSNGQRSPDPLHHG